MPAIAPGFVDLFQNNRIAKLLIQIGSVTDHSIVNYVIGIPEGHGTIHTIEVFSHDFNQLVLTAEVNYHICAVVV
jgi:hypothetical protein